MSPMFTVCVLHINDRETVHTGARAGVYTEFQGKHLKSIIKPYIEKWVINPKLKISRYLISLSA